MLLMKTIKKTDIFSELSECRHMLCLLFREYSVIVRVFDKDSAFYSRFRKLRHRVGLVLFKYSEADHSIDRKKAGKSWWLTEAYMPLQLELDMREDAHSLLVYKETLCSLLKDIYENLDRSLNELDRRGVQIFGHAGRITRDRVRHEVYCFLENVRMKPKTKRAWEIQAGLTVVPGGRN